MALVVLLGAVGCVLRWGIEEGVERWVLKFRPFATMLVNLLGCAIAGWFFARSHTSWSSHASTINRDALTGFCGGFTTFSSALAIPTLLYTDGHRMRAVLLIVGTALGAVGSFWLGQRLGGGALTS